MRRPRLAFKYKNKPPLVTINTVKDVKKDRTVYVRTDDDGFYLVVFINKKSNYIVGERVLHTTRRCVKRRGKQYCYKYIRIPLPWSSLFNYKRIELTIKIYRLQEKDNKREYRRYLYDKTVYSLKSKERKQLEHEHLEYYDIDTTHDNYYNDHDNNYDYEYEEEVIDIDF